MKSTIRTLAGCGLTALGLFLAVGCGGGEPTKPDPGRADPAGDAKAPPKADPGTKPDTPKSDTAKTTNPPVVKAAAGTGAVIGRVTFNGDPPKPREINFGAEKKCHLHHDKPPTDESLMVSADKSIKWVLVRIAGKVPGSFPPPTEPAVLDQKGCVFHPHVLAIQAGQSVDVKNSDEVLHNVRCESTINPPFNFNLPKVGDSKTVKFDAAETGLKLKCDVHFWMGGVIHVIPHPFFAVTGDDGRFKIEKLPPGTHKLEVWHEKLGKQTKDVTVKDGEVLTVDFTFDPKN
ncbi:MAG TPA: carboxypeptidase regulatory-like domain-containing protein [Gemmataceae bacterium]|jgi:plastocyanin|nr:carboxypeptidase regulatory-like domain-containing protein [Gemmataceae bacterium]